MKRITNKILALLVAPLLAVGCIEESKPESSVMLPDQISLDGMARSFAVAMMMPDKCGFLSNYGSQADFGVPAMHIMTDAMLEDIAIQGANPGYFQFYPWAYNLGMDDQSWPTGYFWEHYYAYIKIANDLIGMINDNADNFEDAKVYLGYAYAYRAMYYLDLARMYEPKENNYTDVSNVLGLTVPIVTELTTQAEIENNPRLPREEVYAFILSDLEKAEGYLKGAGTNYTYPTLGAVYGLYARAYLEMAYWNGGDKDAFSEAAYYAREAIKVSGKTPLTEAQWTDPTTGFNSGSSNNSWIWGLTVAKENLINLVSFTAHISAEALWGYSSYTFPGISKALYDKINKKDFRRKSFLSPDQTEWTSGTYRFAPSGEWLDYFFYYNATPYTAIKFRPAQGECVDYNIGNAADHPLMRVEEMFFIEMEAYAGMGNLAKAKELLNTFMTYRVTDGSYDCSLLASDFETFTDEMLVQKRIEFWGEGIVFYDYKRLDEGITRYYTDTNHPDIWQFNTEGRSPQWNFVINRGEFQSNIGINASTNNPDPSGLLKVPNK